LVLDLFGRLSPGAGLALGRPSFPSRQRNRLSQGAAGGLRDTQGRKGAVVRIALARIVKENWFKAQATVGFWPANAQGDDVVVYAEIRTKQIATFHTLRQQLEKCEGRFNAALSDFVAPATSGVPDYIGAFVVTAGTGEDVIADRFKNANDDYSWILCKALADRLAEAFAERMHQRVRQEFWGYAPDETLPPDD
jgi:5-methyltetrahydrofolate--homocysteine methyltransferase